MSLIRELSVALEMSTEDITRIIISAPHRYKMYEIPKRSGDGHRIIAQPARELKDIQRYVLANKLNRLRIHSLATAYRPGKNILDNAAPHARRRVILKLDFRDFFHSIEPDHLQSLLRKSELPSIARADRTLLNFIFFWRNPATGHLCLSIGAPSSPFISNAIMEPLDREFQKVARQHSVICTRYADDITLSANSIENLLRTEAGIRAAVARCKQPKLLFNENKRGIFTTAGRRVVTGLIITPDGKVSLGRERKRRISSALHHIAIGRNVTAEHRQKTRGWLAYAKAVEPQFFHSMALKYPGVFPSVIGLPFVNSMSLSEIDF